MLFREIHVYYGKSSEGYYEKSREPGRLFELKEWPSSHWVSETHEVEYVLVD